MGVSATVRMEPEVCFPSPHRHANGQRVVSLTRLMALQTKVSADQRLQEVS